MQRGEESFSRISHKELQTCVSRFKKVAADLKREWDEEVAKYEETMEYRTKDGRTLQLPRRNYKNHTGEVDDPTLYPYHNCAYPLIDCYDWLYEKGQDDEPDLGQDIPDPAQINGFADLLFLLRGRTDRFRVNEYKQATHPGYLGCSNFSIRRVTGVDVATNHWDSFRVADSLESKEEGGMGLHLVPFQDREKLALRLFRHAVSPFQQDFHLAAGLLLNMKRNIFFSDPSFLERFLAIWLQEQRMCDGRCCERTLNLDHTCHDYLSLCGLMNNVVQSTLTDEVTMVFAAAIKISFDTANPGAGQLEDKLVAGEETYQSLMKSNHGIAMTVKQNIYLARRLFRDDSSEEDDSDNDGFDPEDDEFDEKDLVPYDFLERLADALANLGQHSVKYLSLGSIMGENPLELLELKNVLRLLIYLGEMCARRLASTRRSSELCSKIVESIVQCYIPYTRFQDSSNRFSTDSWLTAFRDENLISTDRYEARILRATTLHRLLLREERGIKFHPPQEAIDMFRTMFCLGLVSLSALGCGWGDLIVWNRVMPDQQPAMDPLLFDMACNYTPNEFEYTEGNDDDARNNIVLTPNQVKARHNYALMLMVRAWKQPWTPESHFSFSRLFREAVFVAHQCAHHVGLSRDIARKIVEFLPRNGWKDVPYYCWCVSCSDRGQQVGLYQKLREGNSNNAPRPSTYVECPKCQIAVYKNEKHRKQHWPVHRRYCGRAPLCVWGKEEDALCHAIASGGDDTLTQLEDDDDENWEDEGDAEDDASWESIESDEEEQGRVTCSVSRTTKLLTKYFERQERKRTFHGL